MKQILILVIGLFLAFGVFAQDSGTKPKTKAKVKSTTEVKPKKEETEAIKKIGPPRNLSLEPAQPQPQATHK